MVSITWLGHSAFLIRLDGHKILVDPWLSNPMAPKEKPPLNDVELIVVTHGHSDHVGEAIDIMKTSQAKLVAIYDLMNYLIQQGADPKRVIGGNIGGPMRTGIGNIRIALTPATHSSPVGSPVGVVLIGDEATIYHAGDTGVTMDMQLIGELYKPDIALLPIGGHFTMDPREAAYAVKLLKPKVVIPMHYGTFPVLYGTPEEFKKEIEKLKLDVKVVVLKPGETYTPE